MPDHDELQAGPVPLYQQLASRLRREISHGVFKPGDRLPSEEALCAQFGVSRITVRAALDQLVDANLLWRKRGKGTFVSNVPVEHELSRLTDFVEDMAAAGMSPASRVTHWGEEPVPRDVATELGIATETPIVRLERLRIADDAPIAFDVTFLPLRYGRLLDREKLATETIYHQLETQYNIPIVSGAFVLEADRADTKLAKHLSIEPGAPVLIIHRTSYTEGRDPVYYQTRCYRADRVRYRLELERVYRGERPQLTGFAPMFESTRRDEL